MASSGPSVEASPSTYWAGIPSLTVSGCYVQSYQSQIQIIQICIINEHSEIVAGPYPDVVMLPQC